MKKLIICFALVIVASSRGKAVTIVYEHANSQAAKSESTAVVVVVSSSDKKQKTK